jgi:alkanesulfonate monooxygenase SsuD/methylene tetrahydromethanopterin reductase-like flavin-dependent oxidoreductase (luciferase family)
VSAAKTSPVAPTVDGVAAAVAARRYRFADEYGFQELLAEVLAALGPVEREVVVPGAGRIDLVVGQIGVEVKVAGTPAAVGRQLRRYRESGRFDGLVLVTTRPVHLALADRAVPPVRVVVALNGAF